MRLDTFNKMSSSFLSTIKENVLYGNVNASDEEVIEAAKKLISMTLLNHLKMVMILLLVKRGVRLSGGQKQRIAIS